MASNKNNIATTLHPEVAVAFREYCRKEYRTISNQLNKLVCDFLEKKGLLPDLSEESEETDEAESAMEVNRTVSGDFAYIK